MTRAKWKKYEYTGQLGPGNILVFRPIIAVDIANISGNEQIRTLALIDSGTDGTIFNADIARAIGVDLSKCQKVKLGGIGATDGHVSNIRLVIPDFDVAMDIPVVFVENLPFDGLLGQRHFFQRFNVKFEKDLNLFHLAVVK